MPKPSTQRRKRTGDDTAGRLAARYRYCPRHIAQTPVDFRKFLDDLDPEHIQGRLVHLWEAWGTVLGGFLSDVCVPLGHRKTVLIVGCEDSMALQDTRMRRDEILERVNAFMGETYFSDVRAELRLGRTNLAEPLVREPVPLPEPPVPRLTGASRPYMKPDSPVTRCYELFLRLCTRR